MKFILFRHGQTDSNIHNIIQGAGVNTPLNVTGIAQAAALAEKAPQLGLDKIYSSTLTRAIQTATLSAAKCHLAVEPLDGLEEFHYGDAEGMFLQDAYARYGQKEIDLLTDWHNPERVNFALPNGESVKHCQQRVLQTLQKIKADNAASCRCIGIFTHGAVMSYMYELFFDEFKDFANCTYFSVEL